MRFGPLLQRGDIIALVGDLGTGKTTFVQGVASGWGSLDPVSSPSFVLINLYRGANDQHLYHLDAYRLDNATQAADLDLEAIIETGPLVVEWAERIETALPKDKLRIDFRWIDEGQRDMVFSARGEHYQRMLDTIRKQIYGVR